MTSLNFNSNLDLQTYRQYIRLAKKELERREAEGDTPPWMWYYDQPVKFITDVLRQHRGNSWYGWRVILKAAFAEELDDKELQFFKTISGGRKPPTRRVKELWAIVGRRGGKDSTASVIAVEAARRIDRSFMRPGEIPIIACLANTREQAEIVHRYIGAYFDFVPLVKPWLRRAPSTGVISLTNGVEIRVTTNNYRAPRGHSIICCILDEVAFYRSEDTAYPDIATYNAIRPGMLTIPDSMLIGISSPHMQSGLLFDKYDKHFGLDDDEVLVIKAPTGILNPRIEELYPGEIEKALDEDRDAALAEYFAEFRKDLADYVSRDVVTAVTNIGTHEIFPDLVNRPTYVGFVDPSGGSRDSFTVAVAHYDRNSIGVLDCVREYHSPFSPEKVVEQIVPVLYSYGVTQVTGDKYAGEWPREQFAKRGVTYEVSELSKSDIYLNFLPLLNSHKVSLLDNRRLIQQLLSLERKTVRGTGRDVVDHKRDGYDDVVNAAAGALTLACGDEQFAEIRRYLLG